MTKKLRIPFFTLAAFALLGQLAYWPFSGHYKAPHYEARLFATTGAWFSSADLHKLNEGAHYFGQTMIGWTKFPSFSSELIQFATLPADTSANLHMQERQNVILTLSSKDQIDKEGLILAKDFLQGKMDEYNTKTDTKFILTNEDYELSFVERSALAGASFALILSIALGAAFLFLKNEFFPPRLKL